MLLAGAAVLVLALVTAGIMVLTRPPMVPLFTGLALEDAAAIVDRLAEAGIPYQVGGRGDSVLVPASRLHETRLMIARAGLPTGGVVGLESFAGGGWNSTDLERQVRLVQALQGELTRTILKVQGVAAARVHLVLPRESIFAGQSRPAAAAVLVQLKPGHSLGRDQVAAVVHLVAGAVPDLSPDRVTVIDGKGRLLTNGNGSTGSQNQADLREQVETRLASELRGLLEQVLGPGNALVAVRAEVNFDQRETEQVIMEPAGAPLLRSVQEVHETYRGSGSPPSGGPTGTASNLPGASVPVYASGTATTPDSEYERVERLANYELNQTIERVVTAPGVITRLSAAVVINRNLTAAEEETLRNLAGAALGLDPGRGDSLVVSGIPFDSSLLDELLNGLPEPAPTQSWWYLAAAGGAALLVAGLCWLVVARLGRPRRRRQRPASTPAPEPVAPGTHLPGTAPVLGASGDRAGWSDLIDLARNKPEVVARILRTWIADN